MNLNNVVSGAIGAVNPRVRCTLRISTGSTELPDGTREPKYNFVPNVWCQIQPLSTSDLRKLDGLNLQSIGRAIYLNGNIEGVDRAALKGGDLFMQPDGTEWLVTMVLEHWPSWSKCAVTQQIRGV